MRNGEAFPLPREFDEHLELRHQALLAELQELAASRGKVLYDGQWVTQDEAKACHRRLQWRHWRMLLESLALLGLLVVLSYVVGMVLLVMLGVSS